MARYSCSPAPDSVVVDAFGLASKLSLKQRGIVLVLVLWVLALLILSAVALTAAQRTESALALNQISQARFRAEADAGIHWALFNLLRPVEVLDETVDYWIADGRIRYWVFGDTTLRIKVSSENSLVNLNTAPKDLVLALLKAAAVSDEKASALADAIEDWRDADDLVGLNGAEDAEYEEAGRDYGAKDGPFDSVEELQLVLGMDKKLYKTLVSAITVDSDDGEFDKRFAPPLVQAALQGLSLEQWLLEQDEVPERSVSSGRMEVQALSRGGPLYRIVITRFDSDQRAKSMVSLVRAEEGGERPFTILWRRWTAQADSYSQRVQHAAVNDEDSEEFEPRR